MAQATDYSLANQSGANFRSELNTILAAIASQNSGSSDPATTYAYQWYIDTSASPALLKLRNGSNNAWITVGDVTATNLGMLTGSSTLTAGNLSGTIPSAVLGNSSLFLGTTSVALNRSSANQALTGISSVALPGSTSGTITIQSAAVAGTNTITFPAVTGTVITTGDTGTVTNTMLTGAIADTKLATISTAGKVANSATTATNANTASAIVARDASGNFSAGTISAALTGNASTATALATARNIQGVSFDGTANITVVTAGSGISVTGTAVANTGVLSVNGNTGAITNVAVTNAAQSFSAAQRGTISALGAVAAGTTTLDFATANHFSLSLPAGGTVTLATPSNITAGQSGCIVITQNSGTAALVVYGSAWKFKGGAPSVSTTLSSVNTIAYFVESATRITATLIDNPVS